jgi:hypothetical protein
MNNVGITDLILHLLRASAPSFSASDAVPPALAAPAGALA